MATTFDVFADFNNSGVQPAADNPFTYGTETALNVGFTLLPFFGNTNASGFTNESTNGGTMDNWYFRYQLAGPAVGVVATGGTLTFLPNSIPFVVPNDVLMMMPGSSGLTASPDLIVTRFTAPSAGLYDLAGSFTDLQQASVGLAIVVNGTTVFNWSFTGNSPYQGTISFSFDDMVLTQGATIDFVIDSLGSQACDVLGLRALITEEHGVTINGTAGNDTINADTTVDGQPLPTNEDDTINSGAGRDTIDALGGNDFINGGSGSDTMRGGAGNDTYVVDNTADVVIENPNEGTDTVQSSVSFSLSNNVEHLTLTGASNLNGAGNALDNLISGNDGRNVLTGLAGADTLSGGAGRDTLIGGAEADTLTGGSGSDRFVFTAVSDSRVASPDTIIDFIQGEDVIDFSSIDANSSRRGEQAFAFGGENPVANGVNWFESGENTVVQADVDGDANADLQIILTGVNHNLTVTDFFF